MLYMSYMFLTNLLMTQASRITPIKTAKRSNPITAPSEATSVFGAAVSSNVSTFSDTTGPCPALLTAHIEML